MKAPTEGTTLEAADGTRWYGLPLAVGEDRTACGGEPRLSPSRCAPSRRVRG